MTVMIASHNLRELEDLCDHVGLLHKGGILFERELDELKLGINKVQAVIKPMPELSDFEGLEIIKCETRGSLIDLVIRGSKEEILQKLNQFNPVFAEVLPLTLDVYKRQSQDRAITMFRRKKRQASSLCFSVPFFGFSLRIKSR